MSEHRSFFLQPRKNRFYNSSAMASLKSLDKIKLSDSYSRAQDDEDSWVELAPPSRGSFCSSVDAALLVEASNVSSTKGSRHSPKSLQSPNVEFENLEAVKDKLARDMLPPGRNTDWIWDWSSRPEALPPKSPIFSLHNTSLHSCVSTPSSAQNPDPSPVFREFRFRHVGSSALTTPPNSPAPSPEHGYPWSLRHGKFIRNDLFRVEVIFGLVVSNLVTFLLGACIGFCICRKLGYQDPSIDPPGI